MRNHRMAGSLLAPRLTPVDKTVGTFEGLDTLDRAFVLEALGSMPVSDQRMRVLSWFTIAACRCEQEAAS